MTSTVASALNGEARSETPAGTSFRNPKMMGITVTGISMITVPATAGVRILRKSESLVESTNWNNEEITTKVASIAGPPSAIAVTQIAMNAPEVPMTSTYPAPIRPTRTACKIVLTPLTATAANTAQDRKDSLPPAARTMIAGVSTIPDMQRIASCRPRPHASAAGGASSG